MFPLRGQRQEVNNREEEENWGKICPVLVKGQEIRINKVLRLPIYLCSYNTTAPNQSSILIFQVVLIRVGVSSGGRRKRGRRNMTEAQGKNNQINKEGMGAVLSSGGGDDSVKGGGRSVRKIKSEERSRSESPEWIPLEEEDVESAGAVGGLEPISSEELDHEEEEERRREEEKEVQIVDKNWLRPWLREQTKDLDPSGKLLEETISSGTNITRKYNELMAAEQAKGRSRRKYFSDSTKDIRNLLRLELTHHVTFTMPLKTATTMAKKKIIVKPVASTPIRNKRSRPVPRRSALFKSKSRERLKHSSEEHFNIPVRNNRGGGGRSKRHHQQQRQNHHHKKFVTKSHMNTSTESGAEERLFHEFTRLDPRPPPGFAPKLLAEINANVKIVPKKDDKSSGSEDPEEEEEEEEEEKKKNFQSASSMLETFLEQQAILQYQEEEQLPTNVFGTFSNNIVYNPNITSLPVILKKSKNKKKKDEEQKKNSKEKKRQDPPPPPPPTPPLPTLTEYLHQHLNPRQQPQPQRPRYSSATNIYQHSAPSALPPQYHFHAAPVQMQTFPQQPSTSWFFPQKVVPKPQVPQRFNLFSQHHQLFAPAPPTRTHYWQEVLDGRQMQQRTIYMPRPVNPQPQFYTTCPQQMRHYPCHHQQQNIHRVPQQAFDFQQQQQRQAYLQLQQQQHYNASRALWGDVNRGQCPRMQHLQNNYAPCFSDLGGQRAQEEEASSQVPSTSVLHRRPLIPTGSCESLLEETRLRMLQMKRCQDMEFHSPPSIFSPRTDESTSNSPKRTPSLSNVSTSYSPVSDLTSGDEEDDQESLPKDYQQFCPF